jgi:hypothetical protein
VIAEAANWAGGAVVEQAARLLGSVRIYNLIVTNVPGPAVALHLAGSRLREVYPHLPLFERQGLGVALLSYAGRLHVGITADWSLGAFVTDLIERLQVTFDELAAASGAVRELAADVDGARPNVDGARPNVDEARPRNGAAARAPALQMRAVPV